MEKQFTATAYIFHENKVLLHRHGKLGKWLPPGGHIEANETPPEAIRREVMEEAGLEIIFIEQENVKIHDAHAVSFERPYLCLLENIPAYNDTPAHQHIDFIYLARPMAPQEKNGFRWFSYEELQGIELLPDTLEVLQILLKENGLNRLQPEERFNPLSC